MNGLRFIKSIWRSLTGMSTPNQSVSYFKSFFFNLKAFGLKGVLKFPVIVYKNTDIYSVGKIVLNCPMRKGLLRIGHLDLKSQGKTKFCNKGIIEIYDFVEIGGCTIIDNEGEIIFKGKNRVGDGSTLIIKDKLVIGESTRFGFHTFVMDTDDHYTIDVSTNKVHINKKEIIIGDYNWFGCKTFVKKGTVTPNYLIVASPNALLTKDYSDLPEYSVIGGIPAKLIKGGIRRIYNTQKEAFLNDYFKNHKDCFFYQFPEIDNFDEFCEQNEDKF